MHALDILRLEKKFLHWGHDITSENNPFEAGLTFAVNFKKDTDFIGRKALERIRDIRPKKKLELFSLKNNLIAGKPLLLHDEPIFYKDEMVGSTTSSNYSFCYKKNICLAYIKGDLNNYEGLTLEVEGKKYALNHEKLALHDPQSINLRN